MLTFCLATALLAKPKFIVFAPNSDVRGMSANGRYCTGAIRTPRYWTTVVWDGATVARESVCPGGAEIVGNAVDDEGDALAYVRTSYAGGQSVDLGYVWYRGAKCELAKNLPGMTQSWERAISRDGSFSVGFVGTVVDNWPSVWLRDGRVEKLQGGEGEALGISGDGLAIVGHVGGPSGHQMAIWRNGGQLTTLGYLPGGKAESYAWACSRDASVIVGHAVKGTERLPVVWTKATGIRPLGRIPKAEDPGIARAISDDGSLVVGFWGYGKNGQGFVWTPSGRMVSADAFLSSKGISLAGLHVASVLAVSADGHWMAGTCRNRKGVTFGFKARF